MTRYKDTTFRLAKDLEEALDDERYKISTQNIWRHESRRSSWPFLDIISGDRKISELFRPSIAIARYTHKSFGFSHVSYIVLQAMLRSVWEKRP